MFSYVTSLYNILQPFIQPFILMAYGHVKDRWTHRLFPQATQATHYAVLLSKSTTVWKFAFFIRMYPNIPPVRLSSLPTVRLFVSTTQVCWLWAWELASFRWKLLNIVLGVCVVCERERELNLLLVEIAQNYSRSKHYDDEHHDTTKNISFGVQQTNMSQNIITHLCQLILQQGLKAAGWLPSCWFLLGTLLQLIFNNVIVFSIV